MGAVDEQGFQASAASRLSVAKDSTGFKPVVFYRKELAVFRRLANPSKLNSHDRLHVGVRYDTVQYGR